MEENKENKEIIEKEETAENIDKAEKEEIVEDKDTAESKENRFDPKTIRLFLYIGVVVLLMIIVAVVYIISSRKKKDVPGETVISEVATESSEPSSKAEIVSEEASEGQSEQTSEEQVQEMKTEKTPYELHGALQVKGNQIVDANGDNFQICGVSTHGLGWFPQYVNQDSFISLRDDFGANTVRLAMYTAEGEGYCTGGNKENLKKLVTNGVDYATKAGMYAIIDWHILHDLDPNVYKDEAKKFFEEMSQKYAGQDNVLYEICNEPNGGTTWAQVKSYAEEVIPIIRANDPDAIIIVGTPTWSQDVDVAIKDPITAYDNIVYAVHFYADTHKDNIRNKVKAAEDAGYAVLISEFSICDASGNGNNNIEEANKWIDLLDRYGIGFVAWNLSNKAESSSLISSSCSKTSGWTYDELSQSGQWLVGIFNTHSDQGSGLVNGKTPVKGETPQVQDPATPQSGKELAAGQSGDLKVSIEESNSWKEGSDTCVQYGLKIENKGNAAASDWTIVIDLGTGVSVSQIWGGSAIASGNTVTITPASYNKSIAAGATLSDVGLIVKVGSKPDKVSITVK